MTVPGSGRPEPSSTTVPRTTCALAAFDAPAAAVVRMDPTKTRRTKHLAIDTGTSMRGDTENDAGRFAGATVRCGRRLCGSSQRRGLLCVMKYLTPATDLRSHREDVINLNRDRSYVRAAHASCYHWPARLAHRRCDRGPTPTRRACARRCPAARHCWRCHAAHPVLGGEHGGLVDRHRRRAHHARAAPVRRRSCELAMAARPRDRAQRAVCVARLGVACG